MWKTSSDFDEDSLKREEIEMKNIVAKFDTDIELDLTYLSRKIPNSTYEPERYPSLIFRPDGLSTVLITRTGILLFTGANSIQSLKKTGQRILNELGKIGIKDIEQNPKLEIENVVSTFELESAVDLNILSIKLGLENTEYEPEQFPGLVYRMSDGPVCLLFSSGNVVITGATSSEEIVNAKNHLRNTLSE